jgi:hypothetical protein
VLILTGDVNPINLDYHTLYPSVIVHMNDHILGLFSPRVTISVKVMTGDAKELYAKLVGHSLSLIR